MCIGAPQRLWRYLRHVDRPIPIVCMRGARVVACTTQELRDEFDIDMRVLGITSSDRMLLSETAIDLENWRERFERCGVIN